VFNVGAIGDEEFRHGVVAFSAAEKSGVRPEVKLFIKSGLSFTMARTRASSSASPLVPG